MNHKHFTIAVLVGVLCASANADNKPAKPANKWIKLTGYECARMERLVIPMAEEIGMDRPGYREALDAAKSKSDMPIAFDALRGYLLGFKKEVLIRQQYDLKMDFSKKCQQGKIGLFVPT